MDLIFSIFYLHYLFICLCFKSVLNKTLFAPSHHTNDPQHLLERKNKYEKEEHGTGDFPIAQL